MKKIAIFVIITLASLIGYTQSNPAQIVANKIAQKMKDSLSLTTIEREQVYQINLQLHNQKMLIRQQHINQDSVRIYTQRIEQTRDSLYRIILNEEKYLLYIGKKKNIVSNN
jgi:hypothetical protein